MSRKEDEFSCSASGRKRRAQKSLNNSSNNLIDYSTKENMKNIKDLLVNRYSDENIQK